MAQDLDDVQQAHAGSRGAHDLTKVSLARLGQVCESVANAERDLLWLSRLDVASVTHLVASPSDGVPAGHEVKPLHWQQLLLQQSMGEVGDVGVPKFPENTETLRKARYM